MNNESEETSNRYAKWWGLLVVFNILGLISFNTPATWLLPIAVIGSLVSCYKIFG